MLLFGGEALTAKRKSPTETAKREPAAPVTRCLEAFRLAYVTRFMGPEVARQWAQLPYEQQKSAEYVSPKIDWGYHGKLMKKMLESWDEETVLNIVQTFFTTSDPKVTSCDYSFLAFDRLASHLRLLSVKRRPVQLTDRTRRNIEAAQRAAGKE